MGGPGSGVVPLQVPKEWGELPLTAPLETEIAWVHQNRFRCIAWTREGQPRVHLEEARSPAPSEGALGFMQDAAIDPKGFSNLLAKVLKIEGDEESALNAGERKSIAEIDRILATYD